MAAARPLGPAPTTSASTGVSPPVVTPSRSGRGSGMPNPASPPPGDPADGRGHRPARGPERRAVADVAPVAPLPVSVDARHLDLDDRDGHADHHREVVQGRLPELVVLVVPAEPVGEIVE